jgi:superfamily II DNA/RNA helicase
VSDATRRLRVTLLHEVRGEERDLLVELLNGSEVLVATPGSLLRAVTDGRVRLASMRTLVIEDADEAFDRCSEDVQALMAEVQQTNEPMQVVVVASKWSESIRQFATAYMEGKPCCLLARLISKFVE